MTLPGPTSRKPKLPPGHARLDFAAERFLPLILELAPLFEKHWRELALHRDRIPLAPHWERYMELDRAGALAVITARRKDRRLVGYVFLVISPALHYATTLVAVTDMFYLHPAYRAGWNGIRLIREAVAFAKLNKVVVMTISEKLHFQQARVGKLLRRCGFAPVETAYQMRLD